jgi:hypothetical protein
MEYYFYPDRETNITPFMVKVKTQMKECDGKNSCGHRANQVFGLAGAIGDNGVEENNDDNDNNN